MDHPLIAEIEKILNRKLKLYISESASCNIGTLGAQLLCACADGDVFLLTDVLNQIKDLECTKSNTETGKLPPFLFGPFGILHYAAYSNNPLIVETVLLNQSVVEKLVPVNPNLAANVPTYTPSIQSNAHHPHADPTSIHFYTHTLDGSPLVNGDQVNGATALHVSAARNNILISRLLIACGASVRAQRTCALSTAGQTETARRLATPLYDALLGVCTHFLIETSTTRVEIELATKVKQFKEKHLTFPTNPRALRSPTLLELADATQQQSPLAHPLFATVALLLNNGADATLLSCPAAVAPNGSPRELQTSILAFLRSVSDPHAKRDEIMTNTLLQPI